MFPLRNGETVVRLRRKLVHDPYSGEETLSDWGNAEELEIKGVAIAPTSSVEVDESGRQMVVTGMSIYGAAGADIAAEDRVRARSGLWDVTGDYLVWRNPFTGWEPGAQASIKKVGG